MKCLKNSQLYGIGSAIRFWNKFAESTTEEQKKMVNPVRKDAALNATLSKMNIIHFYHR
jgi:hypothetical protein